MKLIKSILFYGLQFTWGLPQNLAGAIMYLQQRKNGKTDRFHYGIVTYIDKKNFGGVSLGVFTFVCANRSEAWTHDTRIHEYGHTFQSLLLGPLYFPVVGIPSFIWCNLPVFAKQHKADPGHYYKLYCESWANSWGSYFAKDTFLEDKYFKDKSKQNKTN